MSIVDPVITSAIIGLAGVIGGYAVQNYYSRKADREIEQFKLKKEKYENLVELLARQIHLIQTMGGKSSPETHEKMDVILNTLWLYGSDELMRYLNTFLDSEGIKKNPNWLKKVLWAMRKDLMSTKMKESEVSWFRAT
jgi:hypothetical protein